MEFVIPIVSRLYPRSNAIGSAKKIVPKLPNSCNINAGPTSKSNCIDCPLETASLHNKGPINNSIEASAILDCFREIHLNLLDKTKAKPNTIEYSKGIIIKLTESERWISRFPIHSAIITITRTTKCSL